METAIQILAVILIAFSAYGIKEFHKNYLEEKDLGENKDERLEDLEYISSQFKNSIYPDPIIAIDFDNTIADTDFPDINRLKPGAKRVINSLKQLGCKIAIWTCRTGKPAKQAEEFLIEEGIEFDAFNTNDSLPDGFLDGPDFADSRKIGADFYIDDKAIEFNDNWEEVSRKLLKRYYKRLDKDVR